MKNEKIKIGIIGCGRIAQVRHIPEYAANPDACLSGFFDLNRERAVKLAEQYGARAYNTIDELLLAPDINAVSVCTANCSHAEITIKALNNKKHVLCEKPMATNFKDCEAMVAAAKVNQKKLMIDHNQRLMKCHILARNLIQTGEIGRILTFNTIFAHGGPAKWSIDSKSNIWFFDKKRAVLGAFGDLGVHKIDLIRYLTGYEIVNITARMATINKETGNGGSIDVDDNAICVIELSNGAIGTVTASWTCYGEEQNYTVIYGEKGVMKVPENNNGGISIIRSDGSSEFYDTEAISTNTKQSPSGIIDAWIDCIKRDTEPIISGENAIITMKALFAGVKSAETNRTIFL